MAIICQQTATISGINSLVCGKLIKIYDMRPYYSTIDVLIEGQISPQVNNVGNAFTIGSERFEIKLISKNVAAGTAVVTLTISDVYVPPPPVTTVTHYLDIYVNPYSWYTPSGAVDWIATKLGDINGAMLDLFHSAGITDYQYVGTSVLSEPNKPGTVTVRIKLQQTATMGIARMVVIPLAVWIAAIVAAVFLVIFFIGVITGWSFTLSGAIGQITGKKYSDKEVVDIIYKDIVPKQLDECNKNYSNPVTAAGCQKAVICGATNGSADAFKTGVDCNKLDINGKIDACLAAYNVDGDINKYNACVNKVADNAGAETKNNLPQTTDWTTLALIGLGAVAVISFSKGSQPPVVIQERAIHEKSLRERGLEKGGQ
jgi:hypothetical protein